MKLSFDEWWQKLSALAEAADWDLSDQRCYAEEWDDGITPEEMLALEVSYADNDDPG